VAILVTPPLNVWNSALPSAAADRARRSQTFSHAFRNYVIKGESRPGLFPSEQLQIEAAM
jgi:hypothetical protein